MEIVQSIQALERALAPLPALTMLLCLVHGLLAWRALARVRRSPRVPCAVVAATRPIGVIVNRRR
jgi:hypothetical protein